MSVPLFAPTLAQALRWMEIVAGLAAVQGTIEVLVVRHVLRDDGVWRWSTLSREMPWMAFAGAYRPFVVVLALRLVAAVLLVAGVPWAAPIVWATSLLVNLRFRGTYNGGSDMMLMVVLSALVVVALVPPDSIGVRGAVLFVAAQGIMSYWIAGVVKLRASAWRSGVALRSFLATPHFAVPPVARRAVDGAVTGALASWGVIVFECLSPVALLSPTWAWGFAAVALCFHLGTVVAFGLNRFLLVWSATWPAIAYAAARLG